MYKVNSENSCITFYRYLSSYQYLDEILEQEFSSEIDKGDLKGHRKNEVASVLCENILSDKSDCSYLRGYLNSVKCEEGNISNLSFLKAL